MSKLYVNHDNNFDEFSAVEDHDKKIQSKSHKHKQKIKYVIPTQFAGIDSRGIPLRLYLGTTRPHYSKLSMKMQSTLGNKMKTEISAILHAYPWLKLTVKEIPENLDVLHSLRDDLLALTKAEQGAVTYKQMIIGASGTIEWIANLAGFKQLKNFTDSQIESLPIYETMIMKISQQNNGGFITSLSPEIQLGFMLVASTGIFVFVNYFLADGDGQSSKSAFKKIGRVIRAYMDIKSDTPKTTNDPRNSNSTVNPDIELETESDTPKQQNTTNTTNTIPNFLSNLGPIVQNLVSAFTDNKSTPEVNTKPKPKHKSRNRQRNNHARIEEIID